LNTQAIYVGRFCHSITCVALPISHPPFGGVKVYRELEETKVARKLTEPPPSVVTLLIDGQEDLIKVLLLARPGRSVTQRLRRGLAKLPAPLPHSLVRQGHATCRHQRLDIAIAEGKAVIQPHAVADDLCRESMAVIRQDREYCLSNGMLVCFPLVFVVTSASGREAWLPV
jgi:hypothetical protein